MKPEDEGFDHAAHLAEIKKHWTEVAYSPDMAYVLGRLEAAEVAAKRTHNVNQEMKAFLMKMRKGPECWCFMETNDPAEVGHRDYCQYFRRLIFRIEA